MNTATYFAIGLKLGFKGGVEVVSGAEVEEWVNLQICNMETPSEAILDLAYLNENSHEAMHNILWWQLAEQSERYDVLRELLSKVGEKEFDSFERTRIGNRDRQACPYLRLARCIESICAPYEVPDDFSNVFQLEDNYWMAAETDEDAGTSKYMDAWRARFKEFVFSFHKSG